MADRIIFNICIPRTDARTGLVHTQEKFDEWLDRTVDLFGGATIIGIDILGLWYDEDLPPEENPVEDHSHWYKIGVKPAKVGKFREHVIDATSEFGQKCIYLERAGEADFIWAPGTGPKSG